MVHHRCPQRTAHHLVGSLVRAAMEQGSTLSDLPDSVFKNSDERLGAEVKEMLGVGKAVAAFQSYGSTSPKEVKQQMERWQKRLEEV